MDQDDAKDEREDAEEPEAPETPAFDDQDYERQLGLWAQVERIVAEGLGLGESLRRVCRIYDEDTPDPFWKALMALEIDWEANHREAGQWLAQEAGKIPRDARINQVGFFMTGLDIPRVFLIFGAGYDPATPQQGKYFRLDEENEWVPPLFETLWEMAAAGSNPDEDACVEPPGPIEYAYLALLLTRFCRENNDLLLGDAAHRYITFGETDPLLVGAVTRQGWRPKPAGSDDAAFRVEAATGEI